MIVQTRLEFNQNIELVDSLGFERHLFNRLLMAQVVVKPMDEVTVLTYRFLKIKSGLFDFDKAYHPYGVCTSKYSCLITSEIHFFDIENNTGVNF